MLTTKKSENGARDSTYSGLCSVCGDWSTFRDMAVPIRETYQCVNCRASLRERITASAILAVYGGMQFTSLSHLAKSDSFGSMSIYEPGISGSYRTFLSPLPGYMNSFYWEEGVPGHEMNGVRHEDLMRLTFADHSFDLIISSDIFEHIRKPMDAFREIHRVLRPGGTHIFSIPALVPMPKKTTYRVDTLTDQDIHILEPYYHGDGRGGKSLVYTDYGSDMIENLAEIGFRTIAVSNDHTDTERARVVAFVSFKSPIIT